MLMKIIDISKGIFTTPVYPGDPEPELLKIAELEKGDPFNLSVLKASLHGGTHIDSPNHYLISGKTIEGLPLEMFIGRCQVIKSENLKELIRNKDIKILLLKGNQELDMEMGKKIIDLGFITVGTELETIGDNEIHRFLLEREIGIIENINLENVEEGEFFLSAPPIKIEGSEASFTRAVLLQYSEL